MERQVEIIDNEAMLVLSIVSALLLVIVGYGIQAVYRSYNIKTRQIEIQIVNSGSDNFKVFAKTCKLVRILSSEFVRFIYPHEMRVGQKFRVSLSIPVNDKIKNEFNQDDQLKLSIQPWLRAELSSYNFGITTDSDNPQSVLSSGLEWNWTVIPLESGIQDLCLKLVFCVEMESSKIIHKMLLDEKSISVSSNKIFSIVQWIKSVWLWLVITMFVTLLAYLFLKHFVGLS
ncbi:hypothetical protein WSM22_40780 [Cytophagales bacterium WSM2-2]|nr:hypothetical protein WSM22_40780 [Cytophagales bacterium WSM2-2]